MSTPRDSRRRDPDAPDASDQRSPTSVSRPELDVLLREWHARHAETARAGRDRLLAALAAGQDSGNRTATDASILASFASASQPPRAAAEADRVLDRPAGRRATDHISTFRRFLMHPSFRAAACLALLAALFAFLLPAQHAAVADGGIVQVADGGRLDAFNERGELIGPCPLQHTDVRIVVTGPFSRTVVRQRYSNPYPTRIEAVYTFPLSHRAAVDRMTMTVGDRVIVGEVKERSLARRIYEQARDSGYVASLLEQERPNIFTQSVANIEPGATVIVEIASIEMLTRVDGEYTLAFPMVVGPRYIPGRPLSTIQAQPGSRAGGGAEGGDRGLGDDAPAAHPFDRLRPRQGVVLLGPASISIESPGEATTLRADTLLSQLGAATAIETPDATTAGELVARRAARQGAAPTVDFSATYVDGAVERGMLGADGIGVVNGRWFRCPPAADPFPEPLLKPFPKPEPPIPTVFPPLPPPSPSGPAVPLVPSPVDRGGEPDPGTGFAVGTDQVPDAARITPMPVRPPIRAGHDISVEVVIDSGGAMVRDVVSTLHAVQTRVEDGATVVRLASGREIPNRDFILRWKSDAEGLSEGVFTHHDAGRGGFVTVVVNPPPRVTDADVRPRELIFVLDTSGSMNGFPMEKARAVMSRAIDSMRPSDSFNIITFAGSTHTLWNEPRPASDENRVEARNFLNERRSGGGTEMMRAIDAALRQDAGAALDAVALANLPADGRSVSIVVPFDRIEQDNARGDGAMVLRVSDTIVIPLAMGFDLPTILQPEGVRLRLSGQWKTVAGERLFAVADAGFEERRGAAAMRIVFFLTDGYVGNDQGIVQAVRDHAGSTRVFAFGVGNSINRYLLEQMALAGRGAVEFVTLGDGADEAVARFTDRVRNPVLTDITITADGLALDAIVPGTPGTVPGLLPDLYDAAPVIFHARVATPRDGTITIAGNAGNGRWSRTVPVSFSGADAPAGVQDGEVDGAFGGAFDGAVGDRRRDGAGQDDVGPSGAFASSESRSAALPVLWARSRVEQLLAPQLAALEAGNVDLAVRREVIALGERFSILTPFTSFVAVEKSRVTVGGRPLLVAVPVELPQGTRFEGFFGEGRRRGDGSSRLAQAITKAVEGVVRADGSGSNDGYVNTNNTSFPQAKTIDPNFHLSDFFGESGQPRSAIVFDTPTATNAPPTDGARIPGVPYASGAFVGRATDSVQLGLPFQPAASGTSAAGIQLGAEVLSVSRAGAPRVNADSTGPRSITGVMEYPDDWNQLTLRRPAAAEPNRAGSAKTPALRDEARAAGSAPAPAPADPGRPAPRRGAVPPTMSPPPSSRSETAPSVRSVASVREDVLAAGAANERDESLLREVRDLAAERSLLGERADEARSQKQGSVDGDPSATSIVISSIASITTDSGIDRETLRIVAERTLDRHTVQPGGDDMWTRLDGQTLVVRASAAGHADIERLLATLRSAVAVHADPRHHATGPITALHPVDDLDARFGMVDEAASVSDGASPLRARLEELLRVAVEESGATLSNAPQPSTAGATTTHLAMIDGVAIVAVGDAAMHLAIERSLNELRVALGLPPRSALRSARLDVGRADALRHGTDTASRRARIDALHRVLAPELLAAVVELEDPEHTLVDRSVFDGVETVRDDERPTVSILVTTLDDVTLERVRYAGVAIEATVPSTRVVVGTIAATDLVRLGLTEGVRRVEVVR